jgi:pimeloyl-ACP methyl ester carboxylesterase
MPSLAAMLIGLERLSAGFRRRTTQVDNHRVVYSEGGRGEVIVLLHGFGASSDSWNRFAGRLKKRFRVIAPDLPGWGESARIDAESYGYPQQVERLHQFLGGLDLDRFHLVGHSMGGFIASAYAARYPDRVITLGLLAPHGITEPQPGDLALSVAAGDNWLVASSMQGFDRLLDKVFVKRPYIPKSVYRAAAARAISGAAKSARIFVETQNNDPTLEERLGLIQAPSLIIWGDQDRVLHVSCAHVFHRGIKNSELLVLPGIGHMPLMEQARECASAWLMFVDKTRKSSGHGGLKGVRHVRK